MPHVPDTVPGKRVPGARARTEGRGQPSNIRGGSRMRASRTYGSSAARLAAILAGASPANKRSPVHVVVISSGSEGDQTAGSLEVKALWGRGDLVRSVKGGASNLAGRSVSESGSPEIRAPREADCGNFGSAEPLRTRRRPCRHRRPGP